MVFLESQSNTIKNLVKDNQTRLNKVIMGLDTMNENLGDLDDNLDQIDTLMNSIKEK